MHLVCHVSIADVCKLYILLNAIYYFVQCYTISCFIVNNNESSYSGWLSPLVECSAEALHLLLIASASYLIPYYRCLQLYFLFTIVLVVPHKRGI